MINVFINRTENFRCLFECLVNSKYIRHPYASINPLPMVIYHLFPTAALLVQIKFSNLLLWKLSCANSSPKKKKCENLAVQFKNKIF